MEPNLGSSDGDDLHSSHTPPNRQVTISWSDLTVRVREEANNGHQRCLLKNVFGNAKPGQMMAILGSSGAGKTTFLNLISGRLRATNGANAMTVDGTIRLNGYNIGKRNDILRRAVAFVEQDDVFPGYLTIAEHLWFNAKLRMTSASTTDEDRSKRINAILTELNLLKVAGTQIGYPEDGTKTLSGGERKRLSVATELLANAPLLYLDEPTTGLDSFTAESVISALQRLAQLGKTIVFTIHQPSSELFAFFDRLYLMSEGQVCFCGDAKSAEEFFSKPPICRPCPSLYNPADFLLEILSKPFLAHKHGVQHHETMTENEIHAKLMNETFISSIFGEVLIEEVNEAEIGENDSNNKENVDFVAQLDEILLQPKPSALTQLTWATWRQAKTFYRTPQWMRIRVGQVIAFSLFYGLCYFKLSLSPRDVANRFGLAYQMLVTNIWDNIDAYSLSIPIERKFLLRENQAGLYSLAAYYVGRQFVELPLIFILCAGQAAIIAAMTNFWSTVSVIGVVQQILALFLFAVNSSSFGYAIGFCSDNLSAVIALRRFVIVILILCNGYFINISSIPSYMTWLLYISFIYYANEAVNITEWVEVEHLDCPTSSDGSETSSYGSCFSSGRELLDFYGFGDSNRLIVDLIILAANVVIWRLAALFILYYRSYGSLWWAIVKNKLFNK